MSSGGRCYWVKNRGEEFKAKGIIVVFVWISVCESQLKDLIGLYASLGWNSLVCRSDYLSPFFPEKATSIAFSVLDELVQELSRGLCPIVLATFSGGSKACMYKVFQIIEGFSEVELNMEDSRLVAGCISGQIYDSDPIEFTTDLGARFALPRSILKMPGASKLVSLFAKGVTSSLDALFLTRFGSQRAEYWRTLYSSVGFGAPFLILGSENDDVAPFSSLCNFAQHLRDIGGNVKVVKWSTSVHVGGHKHQSIHYTSAIAELLEQAVSVFSEKIHKLGEKSHMDNMHDEVSDLICDLQNAAVDSNQSFRRVAVCPDDHFFQPSSSEYKNSRELGSPPKDRRERSPNRLSPSMTANTVLGQILFDVCVPKNVEGWDIKFSGSLNGEPFASINKRVWEVKKNLVKERLMGLEDNNNNKKKNILAKAESLNVDKPIICRPPKVNKTSDNSGVGVSTYVVERAQEVQANLSPQFPNFSKLMLKSHVSGGFWLGLPRQFCHAHLPKHDEMVVLVDENEQEYDTKYLAEKNGLSGGWRGFSIAHKLLDGDVLIFQLIEPHKFKIYIVRARGLKEVDGAMGLLNLDFHTEPIHAVKTEDHLEGNAKNSDIPSQKYLEPVSNHQEKNMGRLISNNGPATNQSCGESDNFSPGIVDGIRFSESLVSFKDVKSFEDFNIHVDGLILDSEIPTHLRKKYYELCCSQNIFLHENLIAGLNSKLAAGIISETINIADAIRASKHNTGLNHLESWDKTLKAFEDLGMAVGFLRARIHKLVNLSRELQDIMELTRNERAEAENKLRALKALIKSLDEQIDALNVKNEELGFVFKVIASDPW
ncbi:hypothetical protein BUALT_Bualt19G0110600 [Buddleja alternifolia]|uniref:TF-B3 domain-containing protein n=1 Tax=Buddleja alternifolia TaxID=168488 RepID=A0AAV6WB53_9LAMI|nr:hypothetical protein BUALT_Bualt19G0110600 [Buddleja alternifolia]